MKSSKEIRADARALGRLLREIAREERPGPDDAERVRRAWLGFRLANVSAGIEWKRVRACHLVDRWLWIHRELRRRASEGGEHARAEFRLELAHLVAWLMWELDEPAFGLLPRDGRDIEALSCARRSVRGAVAWIAIRTGALGEHQKDRPDKEDVRNVSRVLQKATDKSGARVLREIRSRPKGR